MFNIPGFYQKHKSLIRQLAASLPFDDNTRKIVREYMDAGEFGIVFDQIVHDIYEYRIPINNTEYSLIEDLAQLMALPEENYTFLKP